MTEQLRAIVNIIKEILNHGYGSVTVNVDQGKITHVEEMKKVKV
jgi:hypothetical protein